MNRSEVMKYAKSTKTDCKEVQHRALRVLAQATWRPVVHYTLVLEPDENLWAFRAGQIVNGRANPKPVIEHQLA